MGADNAECAGHLSAARTGLRYAILPDSLLSPEEQEHLATLGQTPLAEDPTSKDLGVAAETIAARDGFKLDHIVIYENMFDIAYLEPNRENARVINRYLDNNTFNHTNQPKSLLRFSDLWHYMRDTAPKLDQTLPKQAAMDQLHMQPPGVWGTANQIRNAMEEVIVRSVDGFVINTAESIPDLARMGSKLNPVDMSTFAFRMATNEKARLETQDQVFGAFDNAVDLGKSRVRSFGRALQDVDIDSIARDGLRDRKSVV